MSPTTKQRCTFRPGRVSACALQSRHSLCEHERQRPAPASPLPGLTLQVHVPTYHGSCRGLSGISAANACTQAKYPRFAVEKEHDMHRHPKTPKARTTRHAPPSLNRGGETARVPVNVGIPSSKLYSCLWEGKPEEGRPRCLWTLLCL